MIRSYPEGYREFGTRDRCFFCSTRRMAYTRIAIPSFYEYRAGKRTDDMRAYWVCTNHAHICRRYVAMYPTHDELVNAMKEREEKIARSASITASGFVKRDDFLEAYIAQESGKASADLSASDSDLDDYIKREKEGRNERSGC